MPLTRRLMEKARLVSSGEAGKEGGGGEGGGETGSGTGRGKGGGGGEARGTGSRGGGGGGGMSGSTDCAGGAGGGEAERGGSGQMDEEGGGGGGESMGGALSVSVLIGSGPACSSMSVLGSRRTPKRFPRGTQRGWGAGGGAGCWVVCSALALCPPRRLTPGCQPWSGLSVDSGAGAPEEGVGGGGSLLPPAFGRGLRRGQLRARCPI